MGIKYLLDTNILSEPVKPRPNKQVLNNLEKHATACCTSVTVWHELNYGLESMVSSKRKKILKSYLQTLENDGLIILAYEKPAGEWLAKERNRLKASGKTPAYFDAEIAAVGHVNNLVIVTKNVEDFSFFKDLQLENWFVSDAE